MLSDKQKETLYIQVEPIYIDIYKSIDANYNEFYMKNKKEDIMNKIEIFSMALSLITNSDILSKDQKTLENDIISILDNISITRIDETQMSFVESYLKGIYSLIDKNKFISENVENLTLGSLYHRLDVLNTHNNINREKYYDILFFRDADTGIVRYGDERHPENVLKQDKEILPFVKTYCYRNATSHGQVLQTDVRLDHFLTMFYTMIEVAYKYRESIIPQFIKKEISYKKYINEIIEKYNKKLNEYFSYIPLKIEVFQNDFYNVLNENYHDDTNDCVFETINNDLNNQIVINGNLFNKAKLIGYAGMGKTTTIENIIYKEALQLKENQYNGKIPVSIEMITVSSANDTIEKLIGKKLKTENKLVISELIKRNMINLYIDGINEIRIQNNIERREYLNKIEYFVSNNQNLKIVITDRDSNANSVLNDYPTFMLKGVTREQLENFIDTNCKNPDKVKDKIITKINETPSFMETLKNPFMLKNLITIVECNKKIPEYEEDIAETFLKAIVEREKLEKRDFKAQHILRLLIYVVGKYVNILNDEYVGDNMEISYYDLITIFDEYSDKYNRMDRFDNNEMLDLILKLGILKEIDTEIYTFVDERYYSFIYLQSMELLRRENLISKNTNME